MSWLSNARTSVLGAAVLIGGFSSPSTAGATTVLCNGTPVGTMELDPTDDAVFGEFVARRPDFTLASAAAFCVEDHFNWLQIVLFARHTPVDSGGQRLTWPFTDPPLGGYGNDPATPGDDTLWADNLQYYWNEG